MTFVVFGARGSVGGQILQELLAAGRPVRATSRTAAGFGPGVESMTADLDQPETLGRALEGATGVFLYAHPAGADGFVSAARAAGVQRVVLLSSGAVGRPGSEDSPIARMHRTVEEALEKSGLEWTFIRGGMFATNALGLWAASIRRDGRVALPYPEARTAPVHEADLATLAVAALTTDGHAGRAYPLWGPEALTQREQIARISAAAGRPIVVDEVGADQARAEMSRTMPAAAVDAVLTVWASSVTHPTETSTLIPDLLGRPARTFADWAADHADAFR
jgi:uncharacterized protein YbjT (DUF2867 family)